MSDSERQRGERYTAHPALPVGSPTVQLEPKLENSARLPRDHEKEKIKRQLYNLIDRIDKL